MSVTMYHYGHDMSMNVAKNNFQDGSSELQSILRMLGPYSYDFIWALYFGPYCSLSYRFMSLGFTRHIDGSSYESWSIFWRGVHRDSRPSRLRTRSFQPGSIQLTM